MCQINMLRAYIAYSPTCSFHSSWYVYHGSNRDPKSKIPMTRHTCMYYYYLFKLKLLKLTRLGKPNSIHDHRGCVAKRPGFFLCSRRCGSAYNMDSLILLLFPQPGDVTPWPPMRAHEVCRTSDGSVCCVCVCVQYV